MTLRCFSALILGRGMRQYRVFLISLLPHALIKAIIARLTFGKFAEGLEPEPVKT